MILLTCSLIAVACTLNCLYNVYYRGIEYRKAGISLKEHTHIVALAWIIFFVSTGAAVASGISLIVQKVTA